MSAAAGWLIHPTQPRQGQEPRHRPAPRHRLRRHLDPATDHKPAATVNLRVRGPFRCGGARLLLPMLSSVPARVAGLGCGTGTLTLLMAQAGHLVSGLDLAPRMAALAREKLAAAGLEAEVVVGDASSPPWQPGTFDAVLTRHVLWAMPGPEAALTMWIDLLAPGRATDPDRGPVVDGRRPHLRRRRRARSPAPARSRGHEPGRRRAMGCTYHGRAVRHHQSPLSRGPSAVAPRSWSGRPDRRDPGRN